QYLRSYFNGGSKKLGNFFFVPTFHILKFSNGGEVQVVVDTLDLNQCLSFPDEIAGTKSE
ncbi:hypothetical protein S83_012142, partial [Arachis hypogaea]